MLLALAPSAWAAGATVAVSPTSGDPGTALTVSGAGWTPNDSVQVDIGGATVCQLTADGSGNLLTSNTCQVPSSIAHGPEPLTASDGTTQATGSSFTVTPFASFSAPSSTAWGTAVAVDASASLPQATITRYVWDFGDGSTASTTTPTTSHNYSTVGSYVITLTVVDSSGNTDSTAQSVDVTGSPPTASFTTPAKAPTGTTLSFDGTGSSSGNSGGMIVGYSWNFGDGTTSTASQPTHSYATAGTYPVTLTVTDNAGLTGSVTHDVVVDDRAPTATFSPPATAPAVGVPASFTASANDVDGSIVAYDWNWGDGTADGTTQTASHTYSAVGTYTVTLTVIDNSGNTTTASHSVTVTGIAPTASFTRPGEAPTETTLSFDGSGSSDPNPGAKLVSYDWHWGDGSPDTVTTTSSTTHSYSTAGTYDVTLSVTDSAGLTHTSASEPVVVDDRPPVASLTGPSTGSVGASVNVDGSSSYDPDGKVSTYDWNWGDGTADGTTATPSHTYTGVGTYTVTLTVTDDSGNRAEVGHTIKISGTPPTAAFTVSPAVAQPTNTALTFDGSGSTPHNTGATITGYDWNWGDGTADGTSKTPTHSYTTAGTGAYTVTLTVTDSAGQTGTITHTVVVTDRPPAASYTAPTSTPVGDAVSFDGTSSKDLDGSVVSYDWSWGDGTRDGSGTTPSHTFTKIGSYVVTLTVTDNSGNTATASHAVSVAGSPPTASFAAPPEEYTGTNLSFDASGTTTNAGATITGYDWNWGDGTPDGSGAKTIHSYAAAGTYTVTLTVTDSAGETSQPFTQTVKVAPQPIQTLIIVAAPAMVRSGRASTAGSGRVDLGERSFCPGPGPDCTVAIKALRDGKKVGHGFIDMAPNGSRELTFHLSGRAAKLLRKQKHLSVKVRIVIVRGIETTMKTLHLTLHVS